MAQIQAEYPEQIARAGTRFQALLPPLGAAVSSLHILWYSARIPVIMEESQIRFIVSLRWILQVKNEQRFTETTNVFESKPLTEPQNFISDL